MHVIAPWDGVTTWDGSVQTISYGRDLNQSHPDHCLLVHIGGGQSACLAMTFQYQLRLTSSDSLFRRYRTQPNMNDKLVVRSLDQAVNTQLATFSPIEATAACKVGTTCLGASLVPYEAKIRNQMIHDIGTDIRVESLFIPFASYNQSLQQRLDQLQTQRVDTLIAQQQIQTNEALSTAYGKLASSLHNDPNVISANCVNNVLIPMVKAGMNPAGVTCPGGASSGGSGTTVVVPAK